MITETLTGTLLVNDIEYNKYPPPEQLCKAMNRQWANELIQRGLIRVHKLEYYRKWENDVLGDPKDGQGLYQIDGHPMQMDSASDIYAWCLSLSDISSGRLLGMAAQEKYDCTVVIHDMEKLLLRIRLYLQKKYRGMWLHCGCVHYDRGTEVSKEILDTQMFHFNVFQKESRFQDDKEYRISITNCTTKRYEKDYLDLLIGECKDIISIQPLPKNSP
jgi:hypothetical protein